MQTWNVYQPRITDEMAKTVNREGWDKTPWGPSYLGVTGLLNAPEASGRMRDAVENDLYRHAYIVEAADVADTFPLTNGMGGEGRIILNIGQPSSGSVGDVVIRTDHSEGWICLSLGWAEIADDTLRWFESKVATVQPAMNA